MKISVVSKLSATVLVQSLTVCVIGTSFSLDTHASVKESLNQSVQTLEQKYLLFTNKDIEEIRKISNNTKESLKLRWKSLVILCKKMQSGCKNDLKSAVKSNDWFMRSAALEASKFVSVDESKSIARQLLNDKALVVRSAALDVLTQNLTSRDRDFVWKSLFNPKNSRKGKSLWIRSQALEALAAAPEKGEAKKFAAILVDDDESLHHTALNALELNSDFKMTTKNQPDYVRKSAWLQWYRKVQETTSL